MTILTKKFAKFLAKIVIQKTHVYKFDVFKTKPFIYLYFKGKQSGEKLNKPMYLEKFSYLIFFLLYDLNNN